MAPAGPPWAATVRLIFAYQGTVPAGPQSNPYAAYQPGPSPRQQVIDMARNRICVSIALILALVGSACLLAAPGAQEEEKRVSLDVRDVTIQDALRLLFAGTDYGFTLEPGVSGRLTAKLSNVTFSEALRVLLDTLDLTYRKEGNVYQIVRRPQASEAKGAPSPPVEANAPASERCYWIGPGGRYELQALDSRQVAAWFGGDAIFMSPIPIPVASPTSVGMGGPGGTGAASTPVAPSIGTGIGGLPGGPSTGTGGPTTGSTGRGRGGNI